MPGAANPQALNRYSYVLGNPLRYTDPTGHMQENDDGGGCYPCTQLPQDPDPGDEDDTQQPGEPLCTAPTCDVIEGALTAGVFILDWAGLYISSVEASLAGLVYGGAAIACVMSEFLACVPAFEFAFGIDVAVAAALSPVENGAGYFSTMLTVGNDVLLGNFGYDKDAGVYVGTDSIVSARNSVVGSINESILDEAVSLSQLNYDIKRINGEKPGGYTPLFSIDFLTQLIIKDWR